MTMKIYTDFLPFTFSLKLDLVSIPIRIERFEKEEYENGMSCRIFFDAENPDKVIKADRLEITKDSKEDKYCFFFKGINPIETHGWNSRNYFIEEDFSELLDYLKLSMSDKQIDLLGKKFPGIKWQEKVS